MATQKDQTETTEETTTKTTKETTMEITITSEMQEKAETRMAAAVAKLAGLEAQETPNRKRIAGAKLTIKNAEKALDEARAEALVEALVADETRQGTYQLHFDGLRAHCQNAECSAGVPQDGFADDRLALRCPDGECDAFFWVVRPGSVNDPRRAQRFACCAMGRCALPNNGARTAGKAGRRGTLFCLCGCGRANNAGSRFQSGHDARLKSWLSAIDKGGDTSKVGNLGYAVSQAQERPDAAAVAGFSAADIIALAEKHSAS